MKKYGLILLYLTVIIFNIIIGYMNDNITFITCTFLLLFNLIYLFINKIKYKKTIFFKNKIDILIFIFVLITLLPLIMKTYASLSNTIYFFMKYMFIYSTYILSRNDIESKEDINKLINVILVSSILPVIIKLDITYTKILSNVWETFKIVYKSGDEFSGTFGYANTLAIYMLFCFILSFYKYKESDNKKYKLIYCIYMLFNIFIIIISKCRFVLLVLMLLVLVYIIKKYLSIVVEHLKLSIAIGVVFTVVFMIEFSCTLKVSKPIELTDKSFVKVIDGRFKKGEKALLSFDMELSSKFKEKGFTIVISEINEYLNENIVFNKDINNIKGSYSISYVPITNPRKIKIEIKNNKKGSIKFNKLFINNKEYIVNYKYYPFEIGAFLNDMSFFGDSFNNRKYIYKDCIKMFKDSPLFGHGGNSWKLLSSSYREYLYTVKESHSYFFELLISYGIVGVFAFLSFMILLIYKVIKSKETNKYIFMAFILLFIHSFTFDFNMSFMLIQILFYISISMFSLNIKDDISYLYKLEYIPLIILTITLGLFALSSTTNYFIKDNKTKIKLLPYNVDYRFNYINDKITNGEYKDLINNMKTLFKNEPYYFQTNLYEPYFNIINSNIDKLSNKVLEEDLLYVIKAIEHSNRLYKYDFNMIINRTDVMNSNIKFYMNKIDELEDDNRITILRNIYTKLESIMLAEKETLRSEINDRNRTGKSKAETEYVLAYYDEIVNEINYCN